MERGAFTTWNWCEECVRSTPNFDPTTFETLKPGQLKQERQERIDNIGWICQD